MQNYAAFGVNLGGIWKFERGFFVCFDFFA